MSDDPGAALSMEVLDRGPRKSDAKFALFLRSRPPAYHPRSQSVLDHPVRHARPRQAI